MLVKSKMKTPITISVDKEAKERAKEIFETRGQKISTMIDLYLKRVVREDDDGNTKSNY